MNPKKGRGMGDGGCRIQSKFFRKPLSPDFPRPFKILKREDENQGNKIQKAIEKVHGKKESGYE
jgi:hypothetical protein